MTAAFQDDRLQARNVGKVLRVRGEHTEITLNGLRGKPEVIHANVRVFAGLDWFLPRDGVNIGRRERAALDGDPQAGIDQPAHGSRNSVTRPRRLFRLEAMAADNASAV